MAEVTEVASPYSASNAITALCLDESIKAGSSAKIYLPLYEGLENIDDRVHVLKEKPKSLLGKEKLQALETEGETLELDGLFIIRNSVPPAQLLPGIKLDNNAILVDRKMATNVPGVFAAGDCTGPPYQLAKAVGEGAVAGLSAVSYVDELKRK